MHELGSVRSKAGKVRFVIVHASRHPRPDAIVVTAAHVARRTSRAFTLDLEDGTVRLSRVSAVCYAIGLLVGGAACAGLAFGFEPSRMPASLLDVAAYKLAFLTSIALFGTGAAIGRYATAVRRARADADADAQEAALLPAPDALRGGSHVSSRAEEHDRV
jgi:hypothetical protein